MTYKDKSFKYQPDHAAIANNFFGKLPPQTVQLEEVVLGAIMIESDVMARVVGIIHNGDYFYKDQHQHIYNACIQLWAEDAPIDLLTVTEVMRSHGTLDKIGGPFYLAQLTNKVGSAANVEYHAHIIKEKFMQRKCISISSQAINESYDDSCDVFETLDRNLQQMQDLVTNARSSSQANWQEGLKEFDKNIRIAAERKGDEKYVIGKKTGIYSLDRKTLGFCDSDLIVIAGLPGEGKTTLMLQSVVENCKSGTPCGVFSMEMPMPQLILKILSMESGISIEKLRTGTMTKEEWDKYDRVRKVVNKWPLHICDKPAISIAEARAISKGWKITYKVKAFYFDYIQLMTVGDGNSNRRIGTREQEIGHISRSLKALAMETDAPVIALSQMSRDITKRPNAEKRPKNSDLRDSGSIEQDANMIIFVFRPEWHGITYYEDKSSTAGVTEFICTKNRLGPTDTVKAEFEGQFSRFKDTHDMYPHSYSPNTGQQERRFQEQNNESGEEDLPF